MKITCSLFLFFGLASLSFGQGAAPAWAHADSDVKPDAKVSFGALENGLRYAILPNPEPPDRISMRIYVDAGSLMETEEQRGLAHFIEHMAFNGTTHFKAGEMVEYFQRLGMAFGSDTNAHTSYDETVYKLELPKPEEKTIREGMQLLRDYADGMLFSDEEIEKERGVILSEKLSRDSVEYRTMMTGLKFALPDSLISERSPIGTREVIKGAGRDRFVDFYKRWYVAPRMVVVMTGAVKSEEMVPLIKEYFGGLAKPEKMAADPDLGSVSPGRGLIAMLHTEKEASSVDISIETMQEYKREADTKAKRLRDLRLSVANAMINLRFSELAKEEGAPFLGGQAYSTDFMDFVRYGGVSMSCKPENWKAALQIGEQQLRRALQFGFTESEVVEIKAHLTNSYEEAAKAASTRQSRGLADAMVSSLGSGRVFTHPDEDLAIFKELIEQVDAANSLEALRALWKTSDIQLFVGGNLELNEAEKTIKAVYAESQAVEVTAPVNEEIAAWAYTDFGTPGKVAERKVIEDLGITQIRFENNVRLNLKKTEFEKNSIGIGVRIGGGLLTMPKGKKGLAQFASAIYEGGGLVAHSNDDLRQILAGETVGSTFSVDEDAFTISGGTNSEDILLQCQLMAAQLTAPGYRDEALRQFRKNLPPMYQQLKHTPMGVFQNEVDPYVKGGDPRFGFPSLEEFTALTPDDVKVWVTEPLAKDYLEIGVVGDFEEAAVIEAMAATFGALPERAMEKPKYSEARALEFAKAGTERTFEYASEIKKALSGVFWKTTDMSDISKSRRLNVLGSIFGDRLRVKVREELGETYSPYARHSASDVFTDFGYLFAMLTIDPEQAGKITEIVSTMGDELSKAEITKDELDRALLPLLNGLEQQLRSNAYWLQTVVSLSQEQPRRIEWARSMKEDYSSIKPEEVTALAKEYFGKEKAVEVIVTNGE
jgi:zinc protease